MSLSNSPEVLAKLEKLRRLKDELANGQFNKVEKALRKARIDFKAFLEYVIMDESSGIPITLAQVQCQWINHIDFCWRHNLRAGILAPWGHGKTSIMEGLILYLFGRDPTLRIKLVSDTEPHAMERVGKIKDYLQDSERYKQVFPNVHPSASRPWTEHKIFLERPTSARDASLSAMGITASAIGARLDVIIFDDINNEKNTITQPNTRKTIFENYKYAIARVEPGGKVVFIATRWHEEDVVGSIFADNKMRQQYGWLIQRINPDMTGIDCEFYYPEHLAPVKDRLSNLIEMWEGGIIHGAA